MASGSGEGRVGLDADGVEEVRRIMYVNIPFAIVLLLDGPSLMLARPLILRLSTSQGHQSM